MYLALFTWVLFISLMQSVNEAQFLSNTFLSALFGAAAAVFVLGTIIVPLKFMHTSLELHKLDSKIEVLNLIWLLVLYVSRESSFISTQFVILNLDGWSGVLPNRFTFIYSIITLLYKS